MMPHVPVALAHSVGILTGAVFAIWCWQRLVVAAKEHTPGSVSRDLFVLSHVLITVVSYVIIPDITEGWLFINIWHNAQYLVFVWHANTRRFNRGVEPHARFISRLSQPQNALRYAVTCLTCGAIFYFTLGKVTDALAPYLVSVVLVANLAVNFHHYLVDAVIWRRKHLPRGGAEQPA